MAEFYERAGWVKCLGDEGRTGAISAIGAVSPPGGDISEPVSQATLRIVKVFWGLSASLAYQRHFPAIDWLQSYSLYVDRLEKWFGENVGGTVDRQSAQEAMAVSAEGSRTERNRAAWWAWTRWRWTDRLTLETARSIREDYLHQNAFDDVDTYTSLEKQYRMLSLILEFQNRGEAALDDGRGLSKADRPAGAGGVSAAQSIFPRRKSRGSLTRSNAELQRADGCAELEGGR